MHLLLAPLLLLAAAAPSPPPPAPAAVVVIVSASAEWRTVDARWPAAARERSPFGEWLRVRVPEGPGGQEVILLHGGWGKVSAAASAQHAIDRFHPRLLVNLGTCGGLEGVSRKGDVLLVERTVIVDIVELMGDSAEAIADYTTAIDTAWAGEDLPRGVRRATLHSADRDVRPADVPRLVAQGAAAGDWESGAIAWVAARNGVPVLILRGVSDVVGAAGDETYGSPEVFAEGARATMYALFDQLPWWLQRAVERGPLRAPSR